MNDTFDGRHSEHTLRSRLCAIAASFIPPEVQRGSPDTLHRAQLVVAFDVALIILTVAYAAVLAGMGNLIRAAVVATGTIIALFVPYVMRRTSSPLIAGNLLAAILFGVLTALSCRLGDYGAVPLLWYAAVPVVALSTSGRHSAFAWASIIAVSLGAFYVFELLGYAPPNDQTGPPHELLEFLAQLGLVVLILTLASVYGVFESLRAERLRLTQFAVDHASDAAFWLGPDGRYVYVNDAAIQLTGYSREDLLTMSVSDINPEHSSEAWPDHWQEVERRGSYTFESCLRRKDGKLVTVEITVNLVSFEGKKVNCAFVRDVTKRRAAEIEVRELQQQLEFILGATRTGLDIIDAEFNIRYIDPAWKQVYGETAGRKCYEYFMGRSEVCPGCGIVEALKTKRVAVTEEVLVKENNRPVQVTTIPFQNEKGEWLVAEVNVDITERKQIEQTLQQERNRLRSLVDVMDAMDVGITIQDRDYNILYQNRYMRNLTDGVGTKCYAAYEHNDRICDGCPVRKAFSDGRSHTAERTIVSPAGDTIYLENTAHPIRNDAGEITSCFEVVRDVSERKWVQKGLESMVDRQAQINRLQQDLLGSGPLAAKLQRITDGVVDVFGADYCRIWITQLGDRCESGCVHSQVIEGQSVCQDRDRCLRLRASSGRDTHLNGELYDRIPYGCYRIGQLAAGENPTLITNDVMTDAEACDPQSIREPGLVSFAGYQLRQPDGETLGVLALFSKQRITPDEDALLESMSNTVAQVIQKAQAEAENDALNRRLLDASRSAGMAEVATGVLHNVGNVLNSVNVSASIVTSKVRQSKTQSLTRAVALLDEHADNLAMYITEDERGRHLPRFLTTLAETLIGEQSVILEELRTLIKNVEHIKTIVSTQQSYAGTVGLVESVSLEALLEDALQLNSASFQRHCIHIERDYAELPPIEIEKQKLLQVMINLIKNAKHSLVERAHENKRLTLRTAVSADGGVRIEVMDNGVGIPAENLTRIFAHGFTTQQGKGGHGFGLHHSALAIKELGGSLTAHSDGPGKGATFMLELPLHLTRVTT